METTSTETASLKSANEQSGNKVQTQPRAPRGATVQYYDNDFEWESAKDERHERCEGAEAPALAQSSALDDALTTAASNWESFYMRHKKGFFKSRSYLLAEFPIVGTLCEQVREMQMGKFNPISEGSGNSQYSTNTKLDDSEKRDIDTANSNAKEDTTREANFVGKRRKIESEPQKFIRLFEAGCGTGAALLPLLSKLPELQVHGVDVSTTAVNAFVADPLFSTPNRDNKAWVCDLACATEDTVGGNAEDVSFDLALMVFTLSAFPARNHDKVLAKIARLLKPGGRFLFRDYGLYDLVQARCNTRLEEHFYTKEDGVQCYFFSIEYLTELFLRHGLRAVNPNDVRYCTVRNINRRKNQHLDRVFVHGEFQKAA